MGSRYGLEIRTATGADAPGLSALMRAAGHPVSEQALAERLQAARYSHGTALLAQEWGPPSGIVQLHWSPTLLDDAPVAQITLLLVGPDDRRRGIGRQLLKSASQAARSAGCAALQILAAPDQADLAAFCAATGFDRAAACLVRPLRKRSGAVP